MSRLFIRFFNFNCELVFQRGSSRPQIFFFSFLFFLTCRIHYSYYIFYVFLGYKDNMNDDFPYIKSIQCLLHNIFFRKFNSHKTTVIVFPFIVHYTIFFNNRYMHTILQWKRMTTSAQPGSSSLQPESRTTKELNWLEWVNPGLTGR